VDIYDQTGALLKGFNVPYTLDLVGVAVGDVNADDVDEIVVLSAIPNATPAEAYVDIYDQTGALLKGFNVPYTLDLDS
jgi:hypothetical protein